MNNEKGIYVTMDELLSVQSQASHIVDHISNVTKSMLQGNRPSKMHGRGGAFDQIRNYVAGDDVRNIDWNVTARQGSPYIRVFNEERDRPLMVFVDQSASMFFATKKQMKSVVSATLAANFLWMAHREKRPCGGVVLGHQHHFANRPRTNHSSLHGMLGQLVEANHQLHKDMLDSQDQSKTNNTDSFFEAMTRLSQITPKDAYVVLISDFTAVTEQSWQVIESLSMRTNLVATPVYDGVIEQLPEEGQFLAKFAGLQTELDFSTSQKRSHIAKTTQARLADVKQQLAKINVPTLMFSTYQSVDEQLTRGLFIEG